MEQLNKDKTTVAFDVDGTLLHPSNDHPREDMVTLLKLLSQRCNIVVWSGGGQNYANQVVHQLGLAPYVDLVTAKNDQVEPHIAFDDEPDFDLGLVNVLVE